MGFTKAPSQGRSLPIFLLESRDFGWIWMRLSTASFATFY